MADGSFAAPNQGLAPADQDRAVAIRDVLAALKPRMLNVPAFVFNPSGQIQPLGVKGFGVCDPLQWGIRQSGEPWRYSQIYIPLAVTGGRIIIPAATEFTGLFTYGTDKGMPGPFAAGTKATLVETDADEGGALVKIQEKFYMTHLETEIERPTVLQADPQILLDDAWLDAYIPRLTQIFRRYTAVRMLFGDQACSMDLGTLAKWPEMAGNVGERVQRNGAGVGPANMVPLRRFIESGSRDSNSQMSVTLKTGFLQRSLGPDPVIPIPSGVTQILLPICFTVVGFPVCVPCVPACANTSLDFATVVQTLLERNPDATRAALRQLMMG